MRVYGYLVAVCLIPTSCAILKHDRIQTRVNPQAKPNFFSFLFTKVGSLQINRVHFRCRHKELSLFFEGTTVSLLPGGSKYFLDRGFRPAKEKLSYEKRGEVKGVPFILNASFSKNFFQITTKNRTNRLPEGGEDISRYFHGSYLWGASDGIFTFDVPKGSLAYHYLLLRGSRGATGTPRLFWIDIGQYQMALEEASGRDEGRESPDWPKDGNPAVVLLGFRAGKSVGEASQRAALGLVDPGRVPSIVYEGGE